MWNFLRYEYFISKVSFEQFCCWQLMSEKKPKLEAFNEVLAHVTWLEIMWHIYKKFKWYKQTSTTPELQPHYSMRSLSVDKLNIVISRLNSGQTTCQISPSTGVSIGTISKICSKHCPDLPKSSGSHPVKLSPANICHTVKLITSRKSKTVAQVSKALQTITNQPVNSQMVHRHLRRTGMCYK